jgi:hypothetical protein
MKSLKTIMNEAYTGNASTAAWILMTLASKGMGMYTKDEIKRKSKLPDPKIYYFDVKINKREPIEGRIADTSNTGYTHERKAGGPLNPTKVKYFDSAQAIKIALNNTKIPEDFIKDFLSNDFLISPRAIIVTKNGKKEKL